MAKEPSNETYRKATEMCDKAPEYYDEIQSQLKAQGAASGGGGAVGGKSGVISDFWWDLGGWALLTGLILGGLFMARAAAPAGK
jgi:hypothetical protein